MYTSKFQSQFSVGAGFSGNEEINLMVEKIKIMLDVLIKNNSDGCDLTALD